jgi:adenosylcobinamide kinase / adenosylcobinamide-phosphate guanylyltransferase
MAARPADSTPSLPPITLVLGGARSGKSRFAEQMTVTHPRGCVYLATAEIGDGEMAVRIRAHQARRAALWKTIEAPLEIGDAIVAATEQGAAVLVDCLTLWLSNVMAAGRDVEQETEKLIRALGQAGGPAVFVSNEVGMGIVPDNALARRFRDHAGILNQRIAGVANTVFFVAAGLPLQLK